MQTRFDVIVVGAGPAGSTAAMLLARAGWTVVLVEKKTFPRRKVCGECIAASNLPLLDALGVGDAFAAAAGPHLRTFALMQDRHTIYADLPAFEDAKHHWGRALRREMLDSVLLAQARVDGVTVLQPWVVQSLDGAPGDYRCTAKAVDTRQVLALCAPLVIDAHGSWEPLPAQRPLQRRPRNGRELLAFKANFRNTRLCDGVLPVLSFAGGYGGMVLAGESVATVACCIRADRLSFLRQGSPRLAAGEVVGAMLQRECVGLAYALDGASRDGAWLSAGPLNPGMRLQSRDGLFRVGNAAAEAHPIIGEGMSMAIQSAWLLCGLLVSARSSAATLTSAAWQQAVNRRYIGEWRRQFAHRLRLAAACAHLAMRPRVSSLLVPIFKRWPALLRRGAIWSGKVCRPSPAGRLARASETVHAPTRGSDAA